MASSGPPFPRSALVQRCLPTSRLLRLAFLPHLAHLVSRTRRSGIALTSRPSSSTRNPASRPQPRTLILLRSLTLQGPLHRSSAPRRPAVTELLLCRPSLVPVASCSRSRSRLSLAQPSQSQGHQASFALLLRLTHTAPTPSLNVLLLLLLIYILLCLLYNTINVYLLDLYCCLRLRLRVRRMR